MSTCSIGHGDAGYCEHCPGNGERGTGTDDAINVSRPALAGAPRGWESLDDNRTICGECGAYSFEECICGDVLPIAEELDDSREELRALDAALSLDAVARAEGAVHEFAESIETDVRYIRAQLTGCAFLALASIMDRVSRALDALGRVEERIAGVTCEGAAV